MKLELIKKWIKNNKKKIIIDKMIINYVDYDELNKYFESLERIKEPCSHRCNENNLCYHAQYFMQVCENQCKKK